jgi:hypothetical protein
LLAYLASTKFYSTTNLDRNHTLSIFYRYVIGSVKEVRALWLG